MFTTKNAKKMVCTLIVTLIVVCLFSTFSCSARLSEQDKQLIAAQIEMGALESKNARLTEDNTKLTKENEGLKKSVSQLKEENEKFHNRNSALTKENEGLKERVDQLTKKVDELTNSNGSGPPVPPKPGKIFRVGDKLPPFTLNDVTNSSGVTTFVGGNATYGSGFPFAGIYWVNGILSVNDEKFGPSVIAFSDKEVWIVLKDGTRYVCLTKGGCIISQKDYTILQGEIKAYYNSDSK